jgi:glycosyltransferase 2 family protein
VETAPSRPRRYVRQHWLTWVAYGISIGGLAYVVWNLRLPQLKADLAKTTWWLVVLAILLDISPRLMEAVRWKYLLRLVAVRYGFVLQAIYVGTTYSTILPLSSGEFVRSVMISSRARTSIASVLSTQVVERIADAMALILLVWVTVGGLALPRSLQIAIGGLESLIVLALVGGSVIYLRRKGLQARIESSQPSGRTGRLFKSIVLSMWTSAVRITLRGLLVALFTAIGIVVLRAGVLWLLLAAYHIDLSYLQAAGLFALVTVGSFLPSAPGKVGSWQFFCALGLALFGVAESEAAGFSLVAYVFWTLPPLLIGFGTLAASPFSWSDLRPRHKIRLLEMDQLGEEQGDAEVRV